MLGSESAIEGASAEARGGRMPLVESEGSNEEAILQKGPVHVSRLVRVVVVDKMMSARGESSE